MTGKKKYTNMSLLEKIEYIVKQELPESVDLKTRVITIQYKFITKVQENIFNVVDKEFTVNVLIKDNTLNMSVFDDENILLLEKNLTI